MSMSLVAQTLKATEFNETEPINWWKNPYLLGSTVLISMAVLTMTCSFLLVCRGLHHFHHCSLFLVEMAVGALTTEAIMHLLPALILTEKKPRTATGMPTYFPRLATVTVGVCLLHLLDTASIVLMGRRQSSSHAMEWRENSNQPKEAADAIGEGVNDGPAPLEATDEGSSDDLADEPQVRRSDMSTKQGRYKICSILTAGAVLHSFADGVAIGAAFVKNWQYGLHLSASVGMHELAHKVADFSVLTASGFSLRSVITLNICYWATAFVGLFISVPLSQQSEMLRLWIMTIATAVFVYMALVTMSSMVRKKYTPRSVITLVIGNLGMATGALFILLASVLEFSF